MKVEVHVAVESGTLRIEMTSPEGKLTSSLTRPGDPATTSGITTMGGLDRVPVVFEVVEGDEVTGITYKIAWQD